jgi:hypothetical protein
MGFFEGISSWFLPIGSIVVAVAIQLLVRGWSPAQELALDDNAVESVPEGPNLKKKSDEESRAKKDDVNEEDDAFEKIAPKQADDKLKAEEQESDEDLFAMNDNGWRCACEGGFLPPGMLKSFGSAEAVMRLGTGQCYHKQ